MLRVLGLVLVLCSGTAAAGNWCVARSDASEQALQMALDYACGAGADCTPTQPNGLCFLPNTLQAHASYAFNSYFQRKNNAPDSCSFTATSAIARTETPELIQAMDLVSIHHLQALQEEWSHQEEHPQHTTNATIRNYTSIRKWNRTNTRDGASYPRLSTA